MSETKKGDPATTVGNRTDTEVGSVFVSNYPPYSFWNDQGAADARAALMTGPRPDTPLGLYLHIPFCRKRCKFCYFKVYTERNSKEVETYLDGLASEVELLARTPAVAGRPLRFVYVGGGTPSFISARHLRSLVARLKGAISWDGVEEVTFECEPGTLTEPKLQAIREVGVTRLSLGVENFDDAILEENGRAHLSKEIHRVRPWIAAQGFDQVNVDLIAGMVGETWETWRDSVQKTVDMDPDSVTVYQMELPYNTVYSQGVLHGGAQIPVADWKTKREWQDYAFQQFEAAGYEISSAYTVTKRGGRFVYRDSVWHGCDLLGTGVASFSHVNGVHFQNHSGWDPYLQAVSAGEPPLARGFVLKRNELMTRELVLQLKLGRLDPEYFRGKFGVDILSDFAPVVERLREDGMMLPAKRAGGGLDEDGPVCLTRQGLLQVDSLLPLFYEAEYQGARYT